MSPNLSTCHLLTGRLLDLKPTSLSGSAGSLLLEYLKSLPKRLPANEQLAWECLFAPLFKWLNEKESRRRGGESHWANLPLNMIFNKIPFAFNKLKLMLKLHSAGKLIQSTRIPTSVKTAKQTSRAQSHPGNITRDPRCQGCRSLSWQHLFVSKYQLRVQMSVERRRTARLLVWNWSWGWWTGEVGCSYQILLSYRRLKMLMSSSTNECDSNKRTKLTQK